MAAPVPAEEAVELFHRALVEPYGASQRLERDLWRIGSILKQRPADAVIRVVKIQILAKLGRAGEAHDLLEEVWPLRNLLPPDPRQTYSWLCNNLGHYDKFLTMLNVDQVPIVFADEDLRQAQTIRGYWGAGDAAGMENAVRSFAAKPSIIALQAQIYLNTLRATGLLDHFAHHQQTINRIMRPHQLHAYFVIAPGDDENTTISVPYFVKSSYLTRRVLEDELLDGLDEVYSARGVTTQLYKEFHFPSVLPLEAMPVSRELPLGRVSQ